MNEQHWYSAELRFCTVTSADGKVSEEDSIFLVRAEEFEEAFQKFLALGRRREESYKNMYGHDVRVRFVEILTINEVFHDTLDGAEVWCESRDAEDPNFTIDTPLDPAASKPDAAAIVN